MFLRSLVFFLLPLTSLSTAQAIHEPPDISGFWKSQGCHNQSTSAAKASSTSHFAFFKNEWGVSYTRFSDDNCKEPYFTLSFFGTYELTKPSSLLPGTWEAQFRFSSKKLMAHDSGLLQKLNSGACGHRKWSAGIPNDISAEGCIGIDSVSKCTQEFDLVKLDGKVLTLGERPVPGKNICTEKSRPHKLRDYHFERSGIPDTH